MVEEFKQEVSADELLNQQLQNLVSQARETKQNTQRRMALNKLLLTIEHSGKLSRLRNWIGLPNYEDLYNEAKSKTFLEICQRIDRYSFQYPVMAWVNQILAWRFQDVYEESQRKGITNLPGKQKLQTIYSLEDLDRLPSGGSSNNEMELLKNFIQDDPDNLLKTKHIKGHPEATFQRIILMICESYNWEEISTELGISVSTASNFYQRQLRNFLPYLQKSLQ